MIHFLSTQPKPNLMTQNWNDKQNYVCFWAHCQVSTSVKETINSMKWIAAHLWSFITVWNHLTCFLKVELPVRTPYLWFVPLCLLPDSRGRIKPNVFGRLRLIVPFFPLFMSIFDRAQCTSRSLITNLTYCLACRHWFGGVLQDLWMTLKSKARQMRQVCRKGE